MRVNKYRFVGNDKEAKAIKWGLKTGEVYEIATERDEYNRKVYLVHTPKAGVVQVPYASTNAFTRNWSLTSGL